MDYYNILGVNKTASQDEIKKAYRTLAMQHHPDRNGGDDSMFKKINEAYDTLKDPVKREEYNNPQPTVNFNTNNMYSQHGFEDLFNTFFGQKSYNVRKNKDIKISIILQLEEVLTGKDIIVTYKVTNGTDTNANINIPAGVQHSEVIRFRGLGDNALQGIPRGDLLILVKIEKHKHFEVDGNHLRITQNISVLELILGKKVRIKTLQNSEIEVNIPKGTQPGTILSVPGYGIPNVRSGTTGNLYIKLKAVIPLIHDNTILERIKNLNDEISSST
jgi:curved DNA-binding protein